MSAPFEPRRPKKPAIDDDLAEAVEAVLRDDPEVARLTKQILRAQRARSRRSGGVGTLRLESLGAPQVVERHDAGESRRTRNANAPPRWI